MAIYKLTIPEPVDVPTNLLESSDQNYNKINQKEKTAVVSA